MLYDFFLSLKRSQKKAIFLATDSIILVAAFFFSLVTIHGSLTVSGLENQALGYLGLIMPVGLALTLYFGLHRSKLNSYQLRGVTQTAAVALGMAGVAMLVTATGFGSIDAGTLVVFAMAFLIMSSSARVIARGILERIYLSGKSRKRVLIYGAGQTGQQLAAALLTDYEVEPVGFVDDSAALQSLKISGLHVFSPAHIEDVVRKKGVERVVLAMPSAANTVKTRIARQMRAYGCEVHALPSFADLIQKDSGTLARATVDMDELLGRNKLEDKLPGVSDSYRGHRILVTGAGGSIGSEICRQLLSCKPASLVLLDHSELSLYNIERELRELCEDVELHAVLGSVGEATLIRHTLAAHKIDVVLHTAAYKHVPMVEANIVEGMRNNVLGTKVLADESRAAGVARFTLVSSDKAVRPVSAMGSSKRLAELIVQDLATRSDNTRFSMVRFGNVLGSSGSVIPLFQEQIRRGGPVTLTHGDVTRYFMTVPEAVNLVLLAGTFSRGGDVFVLDMGDPVPIRNLARQVIENSGYTVQDHLNPNGDIEIRLTGLRPGEKLHEELLIGSDMLTTPHPKILRAQEGHLSEIEMANVLSNLRKMIEMRDQAGIQKLLDRWIEGKVEEATGTLTPWTP